MSDYISKKALLEWLRDRKKALRADLSYAKKEDTGWVEHLRHQIKMHSEFIDGVESGRFDIPSPAEGRYKEALMQIVTAYETEFTYNTAARRMIEIAREALSSIGEQKEDTEQ